ncbi:MULTISPECIES: MFS transporter [Aeromonas]|uniref:MFS transporter n=1 Tax=Aeromonas TaxID=642 RepID=UPI0019318510|nr:MULTISPECIES: MFS transporter [Aeromonas]MBM0419445.1 MFS transporter [Aeromonas veronii]MBW3791236.1 MFS transporter [Aeromonas veronii]UXB10077.1 MFS transporter [Aeromonas dhakensis]
MTKYAANRLAMLWSKLLPATPAARILALSILIQTTGLGLLTALGAIYFTKVLGLSVSQVGLGLTVAAGAGLLSGVPMGHLADRIGPRGLLIVLLGCEAVAVLSYLLIDSFVLFLIIVSLYHFVDRAGSAVRGGLIARVVKAEEQVKVRAYLRSAGNLGFAFGAVLAGWGLQLDTPSAYRTLIVIAAVGYVLTMLGISQLPAVPAIAREHAASPSAAIRDRPYMAFGLINMVMSFHYAVLEVGMPLWIASHTTTPKWMITVMFIINTTMVVALQVWVSKRAETLAMAKWATIVAGGMLAASCAFFGLSSQLTGLLVIAALLAAGLLHALGEMLQTASAWLLAYELAPSNAHGQYQGLFSTSTSTGMMLGSAVVVLLAVNGGTWGWLALGGLFLLPALLMPAVIKWAMRRFDSNETTAIASNT